jgi:hypothetical protein
VSVAVIALCAEALVIAITLLLGRAVANARVERRGAQPSREWHEAEQLSGGRRAESGQVGSVRGTADATPKRPHPRAGTQLDELPRTRGAAPPREGSRRSHIG